MVWIAPLHAENAEVSVEIPQNMMTFLIQRMNKKYFKKGPFINLIACYDLASVTCINFGNALS